MIFQNLTNIKAADKNGDMHQDLTIYMGQMVQTLQSNLSDQGYKLPTLTSAQIAQLNPTQSPNVIFINSDTNELIVNLGGTFKTVQVA